MAGENVHASSTHNFVYVIWHILSGNAFILFIWQWGPVEIKFNRRLTMSKRYPGLCKPLTSTKCRPSVKIAGKCRKTAAATFSWPAQFPIMTVILQSLWDAIDDNQAWSDRRYWSRFSKFEKFTSRDREKIVSSLARLVNIPITRCLVAVVGGSLTIGGLGHLQAPYTLAGQWYIQQNPSQVLL